MVFLEVMSSCEAVLSSSLGLQRDSLELEFPDGLPKLNDNFGFPPMMGVPELLHDGEGILRAGESDEVGIKRESLVGAGRF